MRQPAEQRVDYLFHWCLQHTQTVALHYTRGECQWDNVSSWATHLVVEIRKLHDSNLLGLLRLPQA